MRNDKKGNKKLRKRVMRRENRERPGCLVSKTLFLKKIQQNFVIFLPSLTIYDGNWSGLVYHASSVTRAVSWRDAPPISEHSSIWTSATLQLHRTMPWADLAQAFAGFRTGCFTGGILSTTVFLVWTLNCYIEQIQPHAIKTRII